LKLIFCGGAQEVGASCYLVTIDGKNILLDCGIRLTSSKDTLPDFRLIQENGGIDAIIISHAHTDHTGALPAISRQFPNALIYMTHMSKDLTRVLLYDSLKIMEREPEIPIYAENHVQEMLGRTVCFSPNFSFKLFSDSNITATFYSAGHIAGAASIYIVGSEGSLFYSGDISGFRQNTIEGATVPKLRPDVAIFESTYGDKLHANRQVEEQRLIESINEVIINGGKVLVPAFALGRAQEVILILKKAMNRGQLLSCPIYVDGMVKDICRIYKLNPNYLRSNLAKKVFRGVDIFYDDNVSPVANPEFRKEILESKNPCVIIASSGMLTGGPSQMYAQSLATNENNLIAVTGYQDEESPGRDLLKIIETDDDADKKQDRTIKLGEREISVKCRVGKFGLSAHADKMEILNIANNLYPRRIFLVHGNPEAINSLGKEIQKDINGFIYAPRNGEQYEINIKKPRKQRGMAKYPNMKRNEPLNQESIKELWEFIKDNLGTETALSAEELMEIWGYEQDVLEVKEILNNSPYFEPNPRRMFLYHAVKESEIEKLSEPKVMEVNEMLQLADEFFGYESGLYKKGARFDDKIALLYFNFPDIAKTKYYSKIKEFEVHTGWRVEINENVNKSAIDEIVYNLFPADVTINKISYMPHSGKVKVFAEGELPDGKMLSDKFKEITGLSLAVNEEDETNLNILADTNINQMEQNEALRHIDEKFYAQPHRPYKKSIKVTSNGVKYIELSFISKPIGEKYSNVIKELERETGYSITVSDSCNQIEIINITKRLINEKGIKAKRNPSVFLDKMSVQLVVAQDIDDLIKKEIEKQFLDMTGLILEIK